MKLKLFSVTLVMAFAALLLAACDDSPKSGPAAAGKAASHPVTTAAIAAESTGFSVGSPMSARVVYVFFDAQCPHCSELWRNAKPLKSQARFVWIPVGLLNPASTAQGATLLAAADPVAAMDEHEASMLAKRGGIGASGDTEARKSAVAKNTELMNQLGFGAIPTIVANHAVSGALVSNEGALSTPALAAFLGLQPPAAAASAPAR
jgi:thiol:disulfide interchange protein DsbG